MSSIHQHCTGTLYCLQPPRTTRTTHSFMPAFSASITPISFTLVKIQRTMKLGSLNFYGLDGTSIKAQMCNGAIQTGPGFLSSHHLQRCIWIVDPDNVLCACHMIPVFSGGKKHLDGIGLSHCAHDGLDWSQYYVNRWVKESLNYCLVPLMLLLKQIR